MKAPPVISALCLVITSILSGRAAQPNIVFMLVDDMGYADVSCYGAPDVRTPHIDGLAAQGVRFTQCYANGAECTPSRTAIMTGRYPQRAGGMECAIGTGDVGRYDDAERLAKTHELGLPAPMAVLAPSLKAAGYRNAVFGKWHLGYEGKFSPLNQGFDEFFGFLGGNVDYFTHKELSDLEVLLEGREAVERPGYMTHLITDRSVAFLREKVAGERQPFFLYVPFSVPHFPFQGPRDEKLGVLPDDEWTVGTREKYVEMLVDMDESVGRILKALDDEGLGKDTLVVYASDHGAMKPGLNTPFRDYKGTLFEGGIRVPCIARWPGKIEAGSVSRQVCCLMDLTPSFLRIAGAEMPADRSLDGIDILKHVESGAADFSRTLFWRAKRGELTWWAVRSGDEKFIRKTEGGTTEEWLFDLAGDEGEKQSRLADEAKAAAKLKRLLSDWENEVVAER